MGWYWLLVAHIIGDYMLQSDWMAQQKTSSSWPALAHAAMYSLPFVGLHALRIFPWSVWLLIIPVSHFVIDRWRLARYVCWAKNFIAPRRWNHPWAECSATGYHKDRPAWLSVWLLIITDNGMHLTCNGIALWLASS